MSYLTHIFLKMNNTRIFFKKSEAFLIFCLALGVLAPNVSSLDAQRVRPSIQQNSETYLVKDNDNTPTSDQQNWTSYEYDRLLSYDPKPQAGGDYIRLLTIRTEQRYEQIRQMNIPQDEKAALAKRVYKKSNSKISKVRRVVSRHLRTIARSF